ncbi:hypothetical protein RJ639_042488 [Escallonia herrerae]|uniref:F-box domain-containing protein n=1 Tax=Escallonia herrerae TaxID=1293975 RepID=A0AA89B648_9ASTE|nr:hypothetical protein RJ639_042488 [Escallonia herrerae]
MERYRKGFPYMDRIDDVHVNGAIDWLFDEECELIYCLDVGTEEVQPIPSPTHLSKGFITASFDLYYQDRLDHLGLGVLWNFLCICDASYESRIDFWVLRDYGIKGLRQRKLSIGVLAGMLDLPSDIVRDDILSRLDAKTIISCKCVCKAWRNLISDQSFARAHFTRSRPAVVFQQSSDYILACCMDDRRNAVATFTPTSPKRHYPQPKEWLVGSCNVLGLGFSPRTNQYKVIHVCGRARNVGNPEAAVHTVGADHTWRSIGKVPFPLLGEVSYVLLNGALHWLVDVSDKHHGFRQEICSFDVGNEEVQRIAPPSQLSHSLGLDIIASSDSNKANKELLMFYTVEEDPEPTVRGTTSFACIDQTMFEKLDVFFNSETKYLAKVLAGMLDLPSDIVRDDILSRLDAKTIISCKCVCKAWRNLISDQSFAQAHLARSRAAIVYQHKRDNIFACCMEDHRNAVATFSPKQNSPQPTEWLTGSCNGLLLFRRCYPDLFICNPIFGEFIGLLPLTLGGFSNFGFGFSPRMNQYKNGALHWLVNNPDKHYGLRLEIWSFHVGIERVQRIAPPPQLSGRLGLDEISDLGVARSLRFSSELEPSSSPVAIRGWGRRPDGVV